MNRLVAILDAPNSDAAARGMPTQATQGCGRYNVYLSNRREPRRKIDVRCKHCGRRVKFQWDRVDNRGRPRPVLVLQRPDDMERAALVKEMQARNAGFTSGVIPDTHLLSTEFTSVRMSAEESANEKWMRQQREKYD